ncbi:MAG: alpha-hydroxy-acid oxidizing protein [Peptococcaceae bacterium]|nr:alpha-hydroxy-acid oxidizing protein [Peptococcaceae bacterium]
MNWSDLRQEARKNLKGFCQVCPVCDGRACAGKIPGMGGIGTGLSFMENLNALERYKVNLRTLHNAKNPDLKTKIFGREILYPIMSAPITGVSYNMGGKISEKEFISSVITGSKSAGTIGMCGDGGDPGFYLSGLEAIEVENGFGIPIIKPRKNHEVIERIRQAEKNGAIAVGIDIDGAGLLAMALNGQPVEPKTLAELKELVSSTNLPFIVKGIMTVDEGIIAAKAGAAAIVVSNHGGRIIDHAPGAADVLPQIAAELKSSLTIIADGGVRYGIDVLKLLALGADGVLLGRPIITGALGNGAAGVKAVLEKMATELKQSMILTGCAKISEITPRVLYNCEYK